MEAEAAAGDGVSFAATLVRLDGTAIGETGMAGEAAAREAAGRIREARFRAVAVERDTLHRPPNLPFATATLQLAAFRRLGLGVGETMAIAQRLYEGVDIGAETTGLITYPRTGSTAMATAAVAQARAVIGKRFGADCVPARPRTFRSKHFRPGARNAQEAHEAIRPTGFGRTPEAVACHLDRDAARLYGLIWRRALASQMAAARVERVRIELAGEDGAVALAAECSAMVFDGHFRLRDPGIRATEGEDAGDADRGLPALEAGQPVTVRAARAERHAAAPPQRHTEAGLVRRLEARGIGRPSTWAAILAVLQARGYAVLHERRLVPTERGRVLAAFLEHGFGRWMDYGFTAAMEDDLDRIAAGGLARQGMLEGFWGPFDAALGAAGGLTRRTVRAAVEARLDGFLFGPDGTDLKRRRCPACGGDTLELKLSRYGPFVGCAEYPDCGYRRSLSAAAAKEDGYAGPRALGADPGTGMAVTLRRGPTGWYVQRGERTGKAKPGRMSLPPPHEPDDIDLGLALRLLALPRRVGLHPETGAPILAGIGRYAARGAQTGHKVGGSREDAVKLTGGICGRTPQLRDKLVELVKAKPGNSGIANCSLVDPENPNHLAALTGRLDLRSAGIATLKRGDFANLGGIGILRLNTNDLTALPAGVFEGLDDTLTQLSLGDNDLQTIPAGVFDPLTGLSILRLNDNDLSSLPPRIFENLTGLGKLHLDSNPGSARFVPTAKAGPAGGFDDVPQGASVTLGAADAAAGYDDPWGSNVEHAWTHVPASTTVTYDADKGANTANPSFTAPAADGTLTFTLTVTGRGAVSSGSVNRHRATADIAVRVAAGPKVAGVAFASEPAGGNQSVYTAGETIEVDLHFDRAVTVDTAGGTPSVALTVGAGSRTAGYLRGSDTRVLTFGYTVQAADMDADGVDLAADSLALNGGTIVGVSDGRAAALGHAALAGGNGQTVNVAGTGGICDRTLQVRDAIVAAVTAASDCSQVTESHLGEIAGRLDVSAQVSKHGRMAALKAGDFNSLIKVTALDLDNHAIRVFPAGIFGPLTALTELSIAYNQTQAADRLTTLPAGPFEGLTNLTTLRLEHNDLETLPDRIFQPLTNLTTLTLHGNPGSARFLPVAVAGPEGGIDAKPGEEEVKLGGDAGGPWGNNLIYSWRRARGNGGRPVGAEYPGADLHRAGARGGGGAGVRADGDRAGHEPDRDGPGDRAGRGGGGGIVRRAVLKADRRLDIQARRDDPGGGGVFEAGDRDRHAAACALGGREHAKRDLCRGLVGPQAACVRIHRAVGRYRHRRRHRDRGEQPVARDGRRDRRCRWRAGDPRPPRAGGAERPQGHRVGDGPCADRRHLRPHAPAARQAGGAGQGEARQQRDRELLAGGSRESESSGGADREAGSAQRGHRDAQAGGFRESGRDRHPEAQHQRPDGPAGRRVRGAGRYADPAFVGRQRSADDPGRRLRSADRAEYPSPERQRPFIVAVADLRESDRAGEAASGQQPRQRALRADREGRPGGRVR